MNLQDYQIDVLREISNIGAGRAAGVLNAMLHSHISLQIPSVKVFSLSGVEKKKQELGNEALSAVRLGFKGPFSGIVLLVFPIESAAKLVALLTEDEMGSLDLDEIKIGTLTEMGNIVLNSVMGTIGNLLKQRIHYSVPTYEENPIGTLLATGVPDPDAMIVWMQTRFTIEQHQVGGDMILIFQVGSLDLLLAAIDREMGVQS